ncbi:MAG: hydrogenase formation protein HypD [Candidatus Methanodesulfokora sp.]
MREGRGGSRIISSAIGEIIKEEASKIGRKVRFMNFCGTHEWTTVHYGLRTLMPENVELVAGPGCPVCITPSYYIEKAIELSMKGIRVYSFGDAYKLPALKSINGARSLSDARSAGGNVSIVYSFLDAVRDAEKYKKESVFLGIGFETTAPSYAILFYNNKVPENLFFMSVLRLTPPAARYALDYAAGRGEGVDGVIAPGHVSSVIGSDPWLFIAKDFGIPAVVSGFEPTDVLISVAMLLKMLNRGEADVKIEYKRVVKPYGNVKAKELINRVFEEEDASWRGLGFIEGSGLDLSDDFSDNNAFLHLVEKQKEWSYDMPPGCRCAEVVLGVAKPTDCPMFMRACTPSNPFGPCMVSMEGTCAVWARFGGGGLADEIAREIGGI